MKRANIKNLFISLILVLSIALVSGCDLLSDVDTAPPSSPETTENTTPIDSEWSLSPAEGQVSSPLATENVAPSFRDVVAMVKPSVVSINTKVTTRYFDMTITREESVGTGWIIDQKGYIVTNNHVAEAAAPNIIVILDDDRKLHAEIVGADALTDLAVLKIDAENLPAAAVGDSTEMRVGDCVLAIGNSLGQGIRATQGIVSRQGVSIPEQDLYGLIETDAAINPGNSGGPLVNMAGEVIGITSVKLVQVEVEGVGYAISTEKAVPVIQQLINIGRAIHPWLGVSLYTVDEYVVERYSLAVDKGAFLVEVVANSPAGIAGLQPEDVIVGFAGKKIEDVEDLIEAIRSAKVGQEVEIIYWRGKVQSTTSATLIERPSTP